MKRLALVVLAVSSLALVGVSSAAATSSHTSSAGVVVKSHGTSLGTILTAANGRTLYEFSLDSAKKSACGGTCAQSWMPLLTRGTPIAKGAVKASKLGTIKHSGSLKQVEYNGHLLYEFIGDTAAGQTSGQGQFAFNGYWYVVSARGTVVLDSASTTSSSSSSAGHAGW
jgi:predicted lipoprotein with Yx(FWY)xxD motif